MNSAFGVANRIVDNVADNRIDQFRVKKAQHSLGGHVVAAVYMVRDENVMMSRQGGLKEIFYLDVHRLQGQLVNPELI